LLLYADMKKGIYFHFSSWKGSLLWCPSKGSVLFCLYWIAV